MTVALRRAAPGNVRASRYSPEEIEYALTAVAAAGGSTKRAAKALEAEGRKVPESTLRLWRSDLYADRYREIEADELPKRYARLAERCEANAERLGVIEELLTDRLEAEASGLTPRDAAGALRNVSVAKAVNIDKASVIRGRPSEITLKAGRRIGHPRRHESTLPPSWSFRPRPSRNRTAKQPTRL